MFPHSQNKTTKKNTRDIRKIKAAKRQRRQSYKLYADGGVGWAFVNSLTERQGQGHSKLVEGPLEQGGGKEEGSTFHIWEASS